MTNNEDCRSQLSQVTGRGLAFDEWVRKKEAEKRLKKKLIKDAKSEYRAELLEVAKLEQEDAELR